MLAHRSVQGRSSSWGQIRSSGLIPHRPSPCRIAVPVSITNPDLLRHSTELYMDSGFSPLCQRMGAMVAFRRFEEFTRYPECLPNTPGEEPRELLLTPLCSCDTWGGGGPAYGTTN